MSNRERRRKLRLAIDHEANALMANLGAKAYWVAQQRAEEASSDEMAHDWSWVAVAIGRRMAKRPSLLAYVFH